MAIDARGEMKSRLRADLGAAMKAGRKGDAALLRELIAAIDNAEAVPSRSEQASLVRHDFFKGSAEAEKLFLSEDEVHSLLLKEIEKREQAAAEFGRLGETQRADALRAEIWLAKQYVAK
jgi:uncharacterized protein YqeY